MSNHLLLSKASDECELNSHETLSEQSKGMIMVIGGRQI